MIGSCSRHKLLHVLEEKVGQQARQAEAHRRIKYAIENIDRKFKMIDKERATMNEKRPSVINNEVLDMIHATELSDTSSTVPAIRYNNADAKKASKRIGSRQKPKILLNELSIEEGYDDTPPAKLSIQSENGRKTSR